MPDPAVTHIDSGIPTGDVTTFIQIMIPLERTVRKWLYGCSSQRVILVRNIAIDQQRNLITSKEILEIYSYGMVIYGMEVFQIS